MMRVIILTIAGQLNALLCPRVVVYNADYADCNGEYDVTEETVSWAPDRRVYAHRTKDRCGPNHSFIVLIVTQLTQVYILECRRIGLVHWKEGILEEWNTLAQK